MSSNRGLTPSKLFEVSFVAFQGVDRVAYDKYVTSALSNTMDRAAKGSDGFAVVVAFADAITDRSGQLLRDSSVRSRAGSRWSRLPDSQAEQSIRTAKTIVVIFSGFIWILLPFTLRWLVVARQECRAVRLVPS